MARGRRFPRVPLARPRRLGYRLEPWHGLGAGWLVVSPVEDVIDAGRARCSESSAPDLEIVPPPPTDADYPGGHS